MGERNHELRTVAQTRRECALGRANVRECPLKRSGRTACRPLAQTGLCAFVVAPWAPYLSAFRRVSSNFERMYVFTRLPCSIRSNPCRSSVATYSASSRAPAIQPVQRSILRRPSSDTGCWIVTSAI
jgi:hypothetical protein